MEAGGGTSGGVTGRLDDQIGWYDRSSTSNKRAYYTLKVVEIAAAAAIPVSLVISSNRVVPAGFGGLVVVLEGLLQLAQLHANWIGYRSTCEALKHEKYLFAARAGPYEGVDSPERVLAVRVEEIVSHEHSKWVASRAQLKGQS